MSCAAALSNTVFLRALPARWRLERLPAVVATALDATLTGAGLCVAVVGAIALGSA